MTSVGFVTTPLTSGHSTRGVGFYTQSLLDHLKIIGPSQGVDIHEIRALTDLNSTPVDLIHYPYFDLFYHTLPLFKNTKTVVTIHDVVPLKFPSHYPPGIKGWVNFQFQKLSLVSVGQIITVSHASVLDLRRYLSVPDSKIKLVYSAAPDSFRPLADKTAVSQIKAKYHLPDKFVLYVGDINWNKNLPALVTACLELNLSLVLVGKNAADIEHLNLHHPELYHLLPLLPLLSSPLIKRLGFISQEEKIVLYNLATLYCQPSLAEGFGLPVLEAMACGCPVACSELSSLPEIAGGAARLFNPYDPADIKSAISSIAFSAPLQKSLRNKGLTRAAQFSWDKTALGTIQVYQELL